MTVSAEVRVQRSTMPNGAEVFYRPKDHSYWQSYNPVKDTCSGRVAGASTVSKCAGTTNVDGLLDWAVRLANEGKDWREEQQAKGDTGQGAHDVLEALAKTLTVFPHTLQERAVVQWWNRRGPAALDCERIVYSPTYGFAGRYDLLALVDDQRVLYDLKTSTYVKPEHLVQLNLYELARREVGFEPADAMAIIHVDRSGDCREIPVPINPDWAIHALAVYGMGKALRSHITKATKEANVVGAG